MKKQNLWSKLWRSCWTAITAPYSSLWSCCLSVRVLWISVSCFPGWISMISETELHHSCWITWKISKILGSQSLSRLGLVNWKTVKTTHAVFLCFWLLGYYSEFTLGPVAQICPDDILSPATKPTVSPWAWEIIDEEVWLSSPALCVSWLYFCFAASQTRLGFPWA